TQVLSTSHMRHDEATRGVSLPADARRREGVHRMIRTARLAALVLLASLGLGACSASDGDDGSSGGTVTVFAAASLKESFTELGERFEEEHPGIEVTFNFNGSDSLAAGIVGGAPA